MYFRCGQGKIMLLSCPEKHINFEILFKLQLWYPKILKNYVLNRLIKKKGAQKSIFKKWALPFFFFFWASPFFSDGRFFYAPIRRPFFFFFGAPIFFWRAILTFFCNFFTFFCNCLGDEGRFLDFFVGAHHAPFFLSNPILFMDAFFIHPSGAHFFRPSS